MEPHYEIDYRLARANEEHRVAARETVEDARVPGVSLSRADRFSMGGCRGGKFPSRSTRPREAVYGDAAHGRDGKRKGGSRTVELSPDTCAQVRA